MYSRILSSFSLWDEFSIWSALKANIYLNFKSKRNSSILFLVLFPLILKVINFQWQLIISEEKSQSVWLFVWCELGKVLFNWKVILLYAFQSSLHCIYIYDNHDLPSNDRISHRENIIILAKNH